MSANNWANCPNCEANRIKRAEEAYNNAERLYATVPPKKYLELVRNAESIESEHRTCSLREDYEIGIDTDGVFSIDYRASCVECDFVFSFKDKRYVDRQSKESEAKR
jgi:hypothetical protein